MRMFKDDLPHDKPYSELCSPSNRSKINHGQLNKQGALIMIDEVKVVPEIPGIERVYDRACDVLFEQLSMLRGVVNPTMVQPILQTIEVVGRLTVSMYPIIENIHDEEEPVKPE